MKVILLLLEVNLRRLIGALLIAYIYFLQKAEVAQYKGRLSVLEASRSYALASGLGSVMNVDVGAWLDRHRVHWFVPSDCVSEHVYDEPVSLSEHVYDEPFAAHRNREGSLPSPTCSFGGSCASLPYCIKTL